MHAQGNQRMTVGLFNHQSTTPNGDINDEALIAEAESIKDNADAVLANADLVLV